MKKTRCMHGNGWYTDRALVWLTPGEGVTLYTDVQMRFKGRVRLRCNVNGCESVRNVYFEGGRFVKAGRPFVPKAEGSPS